ncbi:membrane-associated protease 1 [Paenibacillus sp. CAA11]|uniref:membrane-associated protease 1 n=1 Tax=Paenibacillus sp. CAA11 TaxID=1532905 RepID=UPI000D389280|nr:membrane-associated protease 1 [Paenibacillus sp. CAA11]AWB43673.1 membrane-associated protease 1 [Paenibacillus sp. CAA11]
MGFRLKVEGAETIELGLDNIQTVVYDTDTPDDSNARSTDVGSTLKISGKILTATDGDKADDTLKLATWSLVPAEKADCYRKLTLEVISADQVVRKVEFPNAFVVDYKEHYGDTEGVGTFTLYVKQKKDKTELAKLTGGYTAN